jgi:hypothetical protein
MEKNATDNLESRSHYVSLEIILCECLADVLRDRGLAIFTRSEYNLQSGRAHQRNAMLR